MAYARYVDQPQITSGLVPVIDDVSPVYFELSFYASLDLPLMFVPLLPNHYRFLYVCQSVCSHTSLLNIG